MPPASSSVLRPIAASGRAWDIDAVRGCAILGLIFANLPLFTSADHYREIFDAPAALHGANLAATAFVEFFVSGKCATLLAFLLGAGLAWQQQRAEAAGGNYRLVTLRRLGALFILGVLHSLLLWWGDVLCLYAIIGTGALLMTGLPALWRRLAAAGLIGGWLFFFTALSVLGVATDSGPIEADESDPVFEWARHAIAVIETTYRQGSFLAVAKLRALEAAAWQALAILYVPLYLGIVLLGYDAVRTGWFPRAGRLPARPVVLTLAAIALALTATHTYLAAIHPISAIAEITNIAVAIPASILLAAVYLLAILRLAAGRASFALQPAALVGRTALSNYLLQSLLAALLFHPYGAGLFGRLDAGPVLLVAIGIAALQLALTRAWLAVFPTGPMEWLWRRATYGRPQAA